MRDRTGILIALVVLVTAFSHLPIAVRFEEDVGLGWLYRIRGVLEAPEGAAVIAVDEDSVAWLQRNSNRLSAVAPDLRACLSDEAVAMLGAIRSPAGLPRELFACLIERVRKEQPRLLIFDIHFALARPGDERLAQAVERAGNVLLFERVARRASPDEGGAALVLRQGPVGMLKSVALGTVGFQVESGPGRVTARYRTSIEPFTDLPVMPIEALWRASGETPALSDRELFWFYGPPWTVPTWSIRDVFDPNAQRPLRLRDRVVFVGVSHQRSDPPLDGFAVPAFSNGFSGVELAATAYLNLRHGDRLVAIDGAARAAVIALVTLAIGAAALFAPSRLALGVSVGVTLVAAAGTAALFLRGVWVPMLVPLLLSLPLTGLIGLERRLRFARRVARAMLPSSMSREMLEGGSADPKKQMASAMFVDIVGSTGLAERQGPERYAAILGRYYRLVTEAVDRNGGAVYEYQGDGILALFTESEVGPRHALGACTAALAIERSLLSGRADRELAGAALRIGIATGPIMIGMLKFGEHISVSTMGDAVHRAFRLQEMGREVMQSEARPVAAILIDGETATKSSDMGSALTPYATRVLRGKSSPTAIYRLSTKDVVAP